MSKKRIDELVTEMALPIVDKHGYELVDVEFVKEGSSWYLRIYIDKPEGIGLDDCQAVSEDISAELDRVDPIEQAYFLEVSSPGLDRPLKKEREFIKYKGEEVEVKTYKAVDGTKVFEGELVGLIDNNIVINDKNGNRLEFEKDKVASVKRVIKF
jgi:Uncharacterized protein conserved in bacteria